MTNEEKEIQKEQLKKAQEILKNLKSEIDVIIDTLNSSKKKFEDGAYLHNDEILEKDLLNKIISDITNENTNLTTIINNVNNLINS